MKVLNGHHFIVTLVETCNLKREENDFVAQSIIDINNQFYKAVTCPVFSNYIDTYLIRVLHFMHTFYNLKNIIQFFNCKYNVLCFLYWQNMSYPIKMEIHQYSKDSLRSQGRTSNFRRKHRVKDWYSFYYAKIYTTPAATNGAGTANPSVAPWFIPNF